ncbi:PAS domain S-box-containing protein/diguanylate cyclase (GGDEF)-like protein [Vibrio sp. ES.051]|uniref:GGDEF domain-containing protein n=1 Tax=Vibrio sp. ES.051 TaxID=1761909 RepID=UPI000BF3F96E|nr:sensor domain-containing diguanylate cyclase [Vibrio sp. ES.051]PFG45457.1 PAS domain S-box-containing protein/diguanylate cyclase (GGDEF)-like protein [Vibrio sp. ES.051]
MEEYLDKVAQLEQENRELKSHNTRLQEKLNAALDSNGLCLWEQHIPSGTLTIFNMEWGEMLGYQPHELTATVETWKNNLHPDDYALAVRAFEDHLSGKANLYEVIYRMVHKDGSDSYVYDRGRIVEYDANGSPLRMMGTHIDITKEKRFEQQLAMLASTDRLTGLLNRSAIEERFYARKDAETLQKAAMIFFDIDNFKAVNDNLGHQAGDQLLINIAHSLKELAPAQAEVGRIGGDEFVVLCSYSDQEELTRFCHALLFSIAPAVNQTLTNVTIGISIGVCLFSQSGHHFEEVYHQADLAMYKIKKNGKNGVRFIHLDHAENS